MDVSYFQTLFKVDVYTSCPDSCQINEKEFKLLLETLRINVIHLSAYCTFSKTNVSSDCLVEA